MSRLLDLAGPILENEEELSFPGDLLLSPRGQQRPLSVNPPGSDRPNSLLVLTLRGDAFPTVKNGTLVASTMLFPAL
jgi:hypothetical protein